MAPLRVGVLGPVTVWREGQELGAGQPRQLAVLGVLASRANRVYQMIAIPPRLLGAWSDTLRETCSLR